MHILVTGGAGYIGSHTITELLKAGHTVYCIDNLSNSNVAVIARLEKITGRTVPFAQVDLRNTSSLDEVFSRTRFDAVVHFAGLKAVGESEQKPLLYYQNNLGGTMNLLESMQRHGVRKLVFSSSATVYGSAPVPYNESSVTGHDLGNAYARTKYTIEQMVSDMAASDSSWQCMILRYFNPIGAHPSGEIGENPRGVPNNLMPYISQVAAGLREKLFVFGDDYDTPDGTCIRDYVHVMDIAAGHTAALDHLAPGVNAINLGMGKGVSVMELIRAFEQASGKKIPYEITNRRPGDLPAYYADVTKAKDVLHWQAERTIEEACSDAWRWQSRYPHGYSQ